MKFRILTLFVASSLLFSCNDEENNTIDDDTTVEMSDDDMTDDDMTDDDMTDDDMTDDEVLITYDVDVEPIFAANCVTCHGEVGGRGGFSLHTFELASANATYILERMNDTSNPMPPVSVGGMLPEETVNIVAQWIEDGLLESN